MKKQTKRQSLKTRRHPAPNAKGARNQQHAVQRKPRRELRPAPHAARTGEVEGVLELHPQGYGFLRDRANDLLPKEGDVYVPARLIRELDLRPGDYLTGVAEASGKAGSRLMTVTAREGRPLDELPPRRDFDTLTPINPECQLRLETGPQPLTTRVIDLLAPLGKGQRGLIVAPPRSGKTVLLQHIGQAIGVNHPEVELIVLLVDERPEEVTDMRRNIPGQVFASSLDHDIENHVRLARLVLERCKRLAEEGKDVLLLIDSITRLARAFNKHIGNSGRTMTGGVDIRALDIPKKLFASARAFDEGGSLTILATALVETGSRMDDVIFEEFKGTGNLELTLDRRLADRRVWPAIDIERTGTRREEKLLDPATLQAVNALRRALSRTEPVEAMTQLTAQLSKYPTNQEFLSKIWETTMRAA